MNENIIPYIKGQSIETTFGTYTINDPHQFYFLTKENVDITETHIKNMINNKIIK